MSWSIPDRDMKNRIGWAFYLLYRDPAFGRLWIGRLTWLFGEAFALIARLLSSFCLKGYERLFLPVFEHTDNILISKNFLFRKL